MTEEWARRAAEAMRGTDLTDTDAWSQLDVLSTHTNVDTVEVFDDEIRREGQQFEGPIVVHVSLNYGSGDDRLKISESFPGRFQGVEEGGVIRILNVTVDTSSFHG